jgi:hypothetical protein
LSPAPSASCGPKPSAASGSGPPRRYSAGCKTLSRPGRPLYARVAAKGGHAPVAARTAHAASGPEVHRGAVHPRGNRNARQPGGQAQPVVGLRPNREYPVQSTDARRMGGTQPGIGRRRALVSEQGRDPRTTEVSARVVASAPVIGVGSWRASRGYGARHGVQAFRRPASDQRLRPYAPRPASRHRATLRNHPWAPSAGQPRKTNASMV